MKLAEALRERADLQKQIEQLRIRLMNNAKVQAGEQPAEDPYVLMNQLEKAGARLEQLITRINITNAETLYNGESLTAMLARRDCLHRQVSILRDFAASASALVMRGTRTEIKVESTVVVADLQKEVDHLSEQLRKLDAAVQALNWTTDLK